MVDKRSGKAQIHLRCGSNSSPAAVPQRESLVRCPEEAQRLVWVTPVEQVICQLNAMYRATTLDFALAVGKLVIDSFYSGDLDAWRRRGAKTVSFRKLAKHPDLPMSPAALYRSVAIYEMACRLKISNLRHVSTSHLRLVLPLSREYQARLIEQAETEEWSVSTLGEAVARLREGGSIDEVRNRRPSVLAKAIRTFERGLDETDDVIRAHRAGGTPLTETRQRLAEAKQRLIDVLDRTRLTCAAIENVLADTDGANESSGDPSRETTVPGIAGG